MAVSSNSISCRSAEFKYVLGAVWGQGGSVSAAHGARDVVSVMAVTRGPASVTVSIGESQMMTFRTHGQSPISYFEMPFDSQTTGAVEITLNGKTTKGPEITGEIENEAVSDNISRVHLTLANSCSSQNSLNAVAIHV